MQIAIIGTGSWGTALAILLAKNKHQVRMLGRNQDEIDGINQLHENKRYLAGFLLSPLITAHHLQHGDESSDLSVLAVPASAVTEALEIVRPSAPILVIASKGLQSGTGKLMSEVVADFHPTSAVGALSGPNLAVEIAKGIPTAAVSAFANLAPAEITRKAFNSSTFRVSVTDDIIGVELAGALKNVLAIGAGMSDGLGFGDNTKGAFLARGLIDIARLGCAMGGHLETFLDVAGVGDLFATAASKLSRNYRVGYALGQGRDLATALSEIGQVAEGISSAGAAMILAKKYGVAVPCIEAVQLVLQNDISPKMGVRLLMERPTMEDNSNFAKF